MHRNNLERVSTIFLSSFIVAVLGGVQGSLAQPTKPIIIEIIPGPPDLTVHTIANPDVGRAFGITITVQNRPTAPPSPQLPPIPLPERFEGPLRLAGSKQRACLYRSQ